MLPLTPPRPLHVWTVDWRILSKSKRIGTAHETWRLAPDDSGEITVTTAFVATARLPRSTSEVTRVLGPGGVPRHEEWTFHIRNLVRHYAVDYKAGQALMRVSEPGWRGSYVIDAPTGVPRHALTPLFIESLVRAGKPVRNASFSMERGRWGVARIIPGKPFEGRTIVAFDFPSRRDLLMFDASFRLQTSSRVGGDQWIRTAIHEGP